MIPALILHIGGGGIGLLTGAVALTARKGERLHRAFGNIFIVAMLIMAAMASYLAVTVPGQIGNLFGGIITAYLVATAWMTVKRPDGTFGWFEIGAFLFILAATVRYAQVSFAVARGTLPLPHGVPPVAVYISTSVAALCAAFDLKVILQRGISGAQRIARHLWRMCVAMFVATGSFFLGKQADMPAFVRGSPVLLVLAFAPLGLMIFWLFVVYLSRRFRTQALAG
jgi:hypothetical protein